MRNQNTIPRPSNPQPCHLFELPLLNEIEQLAVNDTQG
jgi:hypothetical protein